MTVGTVPIPASTSATFAPDGTLSLSASSPDLGELFNETGTWKLMPDGNTIQTNIEGATSTGTLKGDELLWLRSTWSRR
jgi:hypothetical protein